MKGERFEPHAQGSPEERGQGLEALTYSTREVAASVGPLFMGTYRQEEIIAAARRSVQVTPYLWPSGLRDGVQEADQLLLNSLERVHAAVVDRFAIQHVSSLQEDPSGGFVGHTGEVMKGDGYKIQVSDPEGMRERNVFARHYSERFLEVFNKHARPTSSLHKALVQFDEYGVHISMDPGKHKELLSVVTDTESGSTFFVYRHITSAFERLSPHSERADFIERVNSRAIKGYRCAHGNVVDLIRFVPGGTDVADECFDVLVRLSRAVKDLDLLVLRQGESAYAARLFVEQRVTNIDTLFGAFRCVDSGKPVKQIGARLNDRERLVVGSYQELAQEKADARQGLQERIGHLDEAKRLNYDLLRQVRAFVTQARIVLEQGSGEYDRSTKFQDRLQKIQEDLQAMAREVTQFTSLIDFVDIPPLVRTYSQLAKILDRAARGFPPDDVEGVRTEVAQLSGTRTAKLTTWSEVTSLEEAIRYLHARLYRGYEVKQTWQNHPLYNPIDDAAGIPAIHLTPDGRPSDIYQIFARAVEPVSSMTKVEVASTGFGAKHPFILCAEQFGYFSFQKGKHRLEISAQEQTDPPEFGIGLSYFESGYRLGGKRTVFLRSALKRLGYQLSKEDDRLTLASFRSTHKEAWRVALAETVRLVYALPNLDLADIVDQAEELFFDGLTNIADIGKHIDAIRRDPKYPLERIAEVLPYLFTEHAGMGDREYILRILLERVGRATDVDRILSKLSTGKLHLLIDALMRTKATFTTDESKFKRCLLLEDGARGRLVKLEQKKQV